jgi:NDP-sugar pyrophosphorylase family protein
MNILVLAAGESALGENQSPSFPNILFEANGRLHVERIIDATREIDYKNFMFAVNSIDIEGFALDRTLALLNSDIKVIKVRENTGGAACTSLLAAEYIDNEQELLILNGNEILEVDYSATLNNFREQGMDSGVVTFDAVHPRYSYVYTNAEGNVEEAAEKVPISRNAVAGFYYFKKGSYFIEAVKNMIRASDSVNGKYFVTPALNYLILQGRNVGTVKIEKSKYHPLKNLEQARRFEIFSGGN